MKTVFGIAESDCDGNRSVMIAEKLNAVRGAVFDLDGTLFDSLWVWSEIDRRFLAARGIDLPPDYMHAVNILEFSQAAAYTIERFGLSDTPEALMAEWTEMARDAYAREVTLKPYAADYLRRLAARGVRLGVATSCTADLFMPALIRNGIADLFSAVVTTGDVGCGKNRPDVFCEAARRLSVTPCACVVFEDALAALMCAKSVGFVTVGVEDSHSAQDAKRMRREADAYVRSFAELMQ